MTTLPAIVHMDVLWLCGWTIIAYYCEFVTVYYFKTPTVCLLSSSLAAWIVKWVNQLD